MPRRKGKTPATAPDQPAAAPSSPGDPSSPGNQMTTTAASSDSNGDDGPENDIQSKHKAIDDSDTASTKPKKRKKELDSAVVSNKVKGKRKLEQTALFKLPFELLDSVGSGDLLALTKTCKVVRAVLLGPQGASIWKAAREQRHLPLPSSMTEQQLAKLLHGKMCYACGSTYATELLYDIRCRLCGTCIEKEIIDVKKVRRELKGVHPRAVDCVRFVDNGRSYDDKPRIDYLVRDLWATSSTLYELAEQDEVAEYTLEAARLRTSTRSRRTKAVAEDLPRADHVESFVERRKAWVQRELEEMDAVSAVVSKEKSAALMLVWDEAARVRAEERKKVEDFHARLQAEHDWTEEQIDWYDENRNHEQVPDVALDDDADAWDDFRDWITLTLEREAAETADRVARGARRSALRPYYDEFASSLDTDEKAILPSFHNIVDWPVFKGLWEPTDAKTITASGWRRDLPNIQKSFEKYQEEIRVDAIRAILAATTGVRIATLSTDSTDYPEDEYDDDWFSRPTHLFLGSKHDHRQMKSSSTLLPYPETLWRHDRQPDLRSAIKSRIDEHQVLLVRLMLKALDVDEENATVRDLHDCGNYWRWRNSPYKSRKERTRRYNWVELPPLVADPPALASQLFALRRRGPTITSLRNGRDLPKIDIRDDDDEEDEQDGEQQGETSDGEEDEEDE
ncbi:hypothetical protein JCM9279_002087 [Rhodotorula babjevae]